LRTGGSWNCGREKGEEEKQARAFFFPVLLAKRIGPPTLDAAKERNATVLLFALGALDSLLLVPFSTSFFPLSYSLAAESCVSHPRKRKEQLGRFLALERQQWRETQKNQWLRALFFSSLPSQKRVLPRPLPRARLSRFPPLPPDSGAPKI